MLTRTLTVATLMAVAAAGLFAYVAHDRGTRLDVAAATHAADVSTIHDLTAAANDNQATVDDLRKRLSDAAGQLADVQAAQAKAQAQADAAADARDRALTQLQDARREIYARDHDAAAWGDGSMPPSLSDELRDEWRQAAGSDPHDQGH